MKPTYSPKFISTIAALSLCVSSAVAHHPDDKWEIKGSSNDNHNGSRSDSSSSGTTTIINLESGKKITTKSDASGTISSLIIKQETSNDDNPTLEVGNQGNDKKIIVPNITIEKDATLNRTIGNGDSGNKWNIIFRGGSTIDNFENNGTISSSNNADTVYLFTDGTNNGGQTVVKNFTNKGTIESTDNGAAVRLQNGAKIETFKNESGKLISATGNAVAIKVKDSRNILGTFINDGTIKAEGKTDGSEGALQFYNTTITSFKNSGTIETSNANNNGGSSGSSSSTNNHRSSRSIDLYKATITNFTNSGTIKASKNNAVYLNASTITTFINEGIIESESQGNNANNRNESFSHNNVHLIHAAIRVQAGKNETSSIQSLENKGTIKAQRAGISLARQANENNGNSGQNNINIGTIKNSASGTIEAGNAGIYMVGDFMTIQNIINEGKITITNGNASPSNFNGNYSAGIVIAAVDKKNPIYGTIENKDKGTITGGDYGVFIEGGSISNLKNSGTIEGNKDGIAFFNAGGTLQTTINNLEIEKGIIRGEQNGINISKNNGNNDQTVVQNLTIGKDATVEGVSGSGLVLGKDKNGSNSDKYQLTGKIEVNGILKGKTAAITNKGQLGSNEGGDVLVIGNSGKIEGVVRNESGGTLKGNITNNGTGILEIDTQGTVGNNTVIKNENSNGSIKILDWKLENQSNGNPKTVTFEGKGNITLEKLTINEGNTDITKVANAIQGSKKAQAVAHTQVQTSGGNGAVTITGDLLRGLVANIDGSKTAAAALNRTLIA
ncbi:MAG: hypothetical protein MSA68_00595, partial [Helicobacter sp.]|nr:hypothetical protein [Helicobacter sp.]